MMTLELVQSDRDMFAVVFESNTSGSEEFPVNLRRVWEVMGSKRDFSHWRKDRVSQLIEGEDFARQFVESVELKRGLKKEVFITLDAAKSIAMLERNEKGRKLRLYFIEREKRLQVIEREAMEAKLASFERREQEITLTVTASIVEQFKVIDPGPRKPGQNATRRACHYTAKKPNTRAIEYEEAGRPAQLLLDKILVEAKNNTLMLSGRNPALSAEPKNSAFFVPR